MTFPRVPQNPWAMNHWDRMSPECKIRSTAYRAILAISLSVHFMYMRVFHRHAVPELNVFLQPTSCLIGHQWPWVGIRQHAGWVSGHHVPNCPQQKCSGLRSNLWQDAPPWNMHWLPAHLFYLVGISATKWNHLSSQENWSKSVKDD